MKYIPCCIYIINVINFITIILFDISLLQSTELFALTYGAFVSELVNDIENDELVNKKLEEMLEILYNGLA